MRQTQCLVLRCEHHCQHILPACTQGACLQHHERIQQRGFSCCQRMQVGLQFVLQAQKGMCVAVLSCVMHKSCHLRFCAQILADGQCTYSKSQILCPCRPVWWLSSRSNLYHQIFPACQTCLSHLCTMILFTFTQARYDKPQRHSMFGSLSPVLLSPWLQPSISAPKLLGDPPKDIQHDLQQRIGAQIVF